MKFFAFILSFYMLALCCFTCGDDAECDIKGYQKILASSQHHEHQHSAEACSPFCSCACCAAAVSHQPVMYAKTVHFSFQQLTFHYNNDFHSYDFHFVWQPPKLS